MVERVARAMALRSLKRAAERSDENGGHSAWTLERPAELKRLIDYDWPRFSEDARAAIAAMREPTEAMCAAATPSHRTVELAPGYSERFEQLGCTPDGNWRAMIDAALREPPRPDATVNDRGRDEPNSTRSEQ